MKLELLSPAGNMEKLKTAVYFGANAVYFSGKNFGLRAFAGNFTNDEIVEAVSFCHEHDVKAYVTVNIVAHNSDFGGLGEYIKFLYDAGVDAIIVSDIGVIKIARQFAPELDIHVSTQANVTNKFSAQMFVDMGVKRIVLARELSLTEIKEIREYIPQSVELEAFVHGAMCISYSGRCLLSNYLASRDSNKGACVQACRWEYKISASDKDGGLPIYEDERGTYILNSKDLNMLQHIKEMADAGVVSFKIEGRMKSPYYVATVTNCYRRALDAIERGEEVPVCLTQELNKTAHRQYTTGFNFKDKEYEESECITSSLPVQTHEFMAICLEDAKDGKVLIEQRNRFVKGDTLEVLSPTDTFNEKIVVGDMTAEDGSIVEDAKIVQQKLYLTTSLLLKRGDILRKKIDEL